jgi:hypothetical protein
MFQNWHLYLRRVIANVNGNVTRDAWVSVFNGKELHVNERSV